MSIKPWADVFIGELGLVSYPCAEKVAFGDTAVILNDHFGDDRESVLSLVEGGDPRGEILGQHREDAGLGIDGYCVESRMAIDRRVLCDRSVDVRYSHEHANITV